MSSGQLPPPPPLDALLATGDVSLFLDFDGTLVDIASGPDSIDVPDNLAARLGALSKSLGGRLALVSGRGLDNLGQHAGALGIARAGSHGAERVLADGSALGDTPQPLDPDIVRQLKAIADASGALFERKSFGAALHYRAVPEKGPGIASEALAIAQADGLVAKHGKCVVELVRPGADKGAAVAAFMEIAPFSGSKPVFIGDDVTDEDGFAKAHEMGGFGIAIGERESQNAQFALDTVRDVHEWLGL
ncbi:trehalose-phosphatase [Pontixanthobacter aquaemixtae]|uniref:Trehalose 6-phosphate phosphatase n=1 Tax=Pontixanthobacter aquaemixtae TaxID=1958940 RepID=A0A844ZVJ1_9SPHN|nr:trehalose-phosphatase [Pontixanthobacter aquaemixtae]MXO91895.1 trehalose-phosphatase [Pontixanthobacter aquaemixtae]